MTARTTSLSRLFALHVALLAAAAPLAAQSADTDIFLAELHGHGSQLSVGTPVNVTARAGYDNQPWFIPGAAALLYVSERDGQHDVFRYDIERRTSTRVTATPEHEFSPTLSADGRDLLVVRWAPDMSTGAHWRYSPEGEPIGPMPGGVARVGYYAVVDSTAVAYFINDSLQTFVLLDPRTGESTRLGEGLGGSPPKAIPGERAVSFFRQAADSTWWIHRLDVATRESTPLVRALPGSTQYAWTPDGVLLMASGNRLYAWNRARGEEWREIAAFDDPGLQAITRIAVSPAGDRIAIVSAVGDGAGARP